MYIYTYICVCVYKCACVCIIKFEICLDKFHGAYPSATTVAKVILSLHKKQRPLLYCNRAKKDK